MKLQRVHGKIHIGPWQEVKALCQDKTFGRVESHAPSVGILDVADDVPEYSHHRDILFIHAGLNDGPPDWDAPWGPHNSIRAYVNAVMSLEYLVLRCNEVYIHCHGGVSRAGIVACLYWGHIYGYKPDYIQGLIKKRYSRINVHPKHWDIADQVVRALKLNTTFGTGVEGLSTQNFRSTEYWLYTIGNL